MSSPKRYPLAEVHPFRETPLPERISRGRSPKWGIATPTPMSSSVRPLDRHERVESDRLKNYTFHEPIERDKVSLDVFWLRCESIEDTDNLPPPGIIAAEIVEDLEAALEEFRLLAESLADVGLELSEPDD